MKKVICCILVIMLTMISTVFAEEAPLNEEILFRGIPWNASITEVENSLGDIGFYSANDEALIQYWTNYDGDPFNTDRTAYPSGWLGYYYMRGDDDIQVAGHSLSDMTLWYKYGLDGEKVLRGKDNSRLYMAIYTFAVLDIDGAYTDIKEKLCALYGSTIENIEDGGGTTYSVDEGVQDYHTISKTAIWYGYSDTSVKLCSCTSDRPIEDDVWYNYLVLAYGKSDSDNDLNEVAQAVKRELLEKESDGRSTNTDGL